MQDLFDRVVKHLRSQGRKSISAGRCMYRAPNGLKCAIGCLISDDQYDCSFESQPLKYAPVRRAIESTVGRKLSEREWFMLYDLQETHDGEPVSVWRAEFVHIAEKYELRGPCV